MHFQGRLLCLNILASLSIGLNSKRKAFAPQEEGVGHFSKRVRCTKKANGKNDGKSSKCFCNDIKLVGMFYCRFCSVVCNAIHRNFSQADGI